MKKAFLLTCLCGLVIAASSVSSCKKSDSTTATMTLYDSLGGTTMVSDPTATGTMIEKGRLGLRSVVDSTIFVIAADTSLSVYFATLLSEVSASPQNLSGFTALSKNLTDFFCVATGAKNFTYSGKSMSAAHDPSQNSRMGMKADSTAFNHFVSDLVVGAQKCGLSNQLIGQVGVVVNSVKSQVVQR